MEKKSVTIKDVAKKAGVGVGTVSRVLNNGIVKDETKKRVQNAIIKLGYKPNFYAQQLAGGKSRRILVYIPEVKTEFHWRLLDGFDRYLDKKEYFSIVFPLTDFKRLENMRKTPYTMGGVDGKALFTISPEIFSDEFLTEEPLVLIENESKKCNSVTVDNIRGGEIAAELLVENNVSDYIFLYSDVDNKIIKNNHIEERKEGFLNFLKNNEIEIPNKNIIYSNYLLGISYNKIIEIFDKYKKPGFFASTDNFALIVLEVASTINKVPGKDFFIVGFDNQIWTEKIGLTTIEQPIEEMGQTAAKLLIEVIEDETRPIKNIKFSPKLIRRKSA